MAVAALIGHGAFVDGDPLLLLLGGVVALPGLALAGAVAPLRYRRMRRSVAAGTTLTTPRLAALATAVVAATAVAAGCAVLAYS